MNISYKWLSRYINLTEPAEEVAKHLTSIGLEVGTVEKIQTIKGGLEGLVVAEVLTCVEHPNSDHLHITTVRLTPEAEPVQIVCGAPNVAAGQKVICATIGTVLYSGDESFTIKKSKIRGVESFGMLCAEDEIGIGNSHDGIIVLPHDAPVGMPAKEYYHIEDDYLIEVDITPNRSDACSHYGVARDLYAYYTNAEGNTCAKNDTTTERRDKITLTKPDISAFKVQSHSLPIEVIVENTTACPRYTGVTIRGVEVKPSPDRLQDALRAIGLRPINNVVDCTNFVLHEMGQALHAFDADKIKGGKVIVKNVAEGTKFVTLDEVERSLSAADLMICNAEEPMCIAGVFGGLDSGVTEETKNVFLESAYFDPVSIRKTARRHGLSTDASFRYERGCDPNNTLYVLKRCALLIQEVAGGEIAMEVAVGGSEQPFAPFEVEFNIARAQRLIGKQISAEKIENILHSLEIDIARKDGDDWTLLVPRYRVDVQRECDVVEDILRIYGYNNIEFPEKVNTNLVYGKKPDPVFLQRRISEQLSAEGFNEILNNSLTKTSYYEGSAVYPLEHCVRILNPLSSDLGVMRQTMLFGGLESIERNVNRKNTDLKFYEFGNCYHYAKDSDYRTFGDVLHKRQDSEQSAEPINNYSEETHLALWITGNKSAQTWAHAEEKTSFYLLHAYIRNILTRMGVNIDKCALQELHDGDPLNELYSDGMHIIAPNGKQVAFIGIVSPKVLKRFDINSPVFYADLNWQILLKQNKRYKPVIEDLPRFPEVRRDFALLIDKNIRFEDLRKAAFETEKKLLRQVFLFDVYEGKNLPAGKKSYAIACILQDPDNTLKVNQIDNIMARIRKTFEDKFEAQLR